MKEKKNKIIWLFFFLGLILFASTLLGLIKTKFFILNPLKIEKSYYLSLLDDNSLTSSSKDKIINWMVFLNKKDSDIYLYIGDYFQKKGELIKALEFYQKAIDFSPLSSFDIYKKQLVIYEQLNKDKEAENLLLFIFNKVNKMGYYPSFTFRLSKELYLSGEKALIEGNWQKTVFWWEKAIKILPDYSFFHLDLASLYYQEGQSEKAKEILNNCLKKKEARGHCQEYLNSAMINFKNEKPGFWREEILKIEEPKLN
jgi:tetratricopeptide (TPR) repeat protein